MTNSKKQLELCHLHRANGADAWCNREKCIYWRLLEAQDVDLSNDIGCGLRHFGVLDDLTPEMTELLLAMKRRLESTTPEIGKARITFRRREKNK